MVYLGTEGGPSWPMGHRSSIISASNGAFATGTMRAWEQGYGRRDGEDDAGRRGQGSVALERGSKHPRWAQAQPLPRVLEPTTTTATTPALPAPDIAGRREHTVAVHCRRYSLENAREWETYAGRGYYLGVLSNMGLALLFCYC
jgi:hypothetical protein